MSSLFNRKARSRRGSYVTIREYTYSSVPKPTPKWSRQAKFTFATVAAVIFVYFLVSGDLGILRLIALRDLQGQLQREELAIASQIVDLDTRKRLLESDMLFIEQVARTEYQFSRPDEFIYELTPKPASQSKHSP